MLDHAGAFGFRADDVAGGVVQKDDRRIDLMAELKKVGGLGGTIRIYGTVVANQRTGIAHDAGLQAHRIDPIARFEFIEIRAIDNARHQLAHIVGNLVVDRHDSGKLVGVVQGRLIGSRFR